MKVKLSGAKKKTKSLLEQIGLGEFWMKAHYAEIGINCLQSAFSLIQRDCKPRRYYWNETRREKTVSIFSSSGLRPRFSRGSQLRRSHA